MRFFLKIKLAKMIKKFVIFIFFILITNCSGWDNFEGALTGQKKKTTDEYLIKEKDPLILPPDYKQLPLPDSKSQKKNTKSLESILNEGRSSSDKSNKKSPLERSIEEELRKNN